MRQTRQRGRAALAGYRLSRIAIAAPATPSCPAATQRLCVCEPESRVLRMAGGYWRVMPTEEDVLTAIRDVAAATGDKFSVLGYEDVASRLGCPPDDPEYQRYLARAETTGIIEACADVDQLEGPIRFRLAY